LRFLDKLIELLIVASPSIGYLFTSTNAPHRTTPEYSTCAESISRIAMIKEFISDHVTIVVIRLGEPLYEFVAHIKPCGMSSKVIVIIIIFVRRK